ncbi:TIGR04348 family glycosyltransferase [Marinobacter sp. BW6]|uniref:selenoneine biosynthesis selenosugar synthase SenB n=1 Tax=Marinobacter sp. BW6 TaxID=2592624 RepID=UPI0011DE7363|nr:selenoneine biosynthesis selenosugar synthase SenB [Marinobacter sp. BW6]TYC62548.1 TIGR04348 family glycosyltransferase [Marinobacter sp. BW6]
MHLILITPAKPGSKAGNRATAERWKVLLENAGHSVDVITEYGGEACDAFIALHAWRSVTAVRRFRKTWPGKPLIVALTGTDIYLHQHEYPEDTLYSMDVADALIGLHNLVTDDIPANFGGKLVTLYQSADGPESFPAPEADGDSDIFRASVIGHLRDEKDSLRAAYAARLLPEDSQIQIVCAGKPHNGDWQSKAEQEMAENPRFHWLGELEKADTRQLMANSQIMVISSVMEGGANVVSEACRAGLPVIASDIPGNVGLLGKDYAGYFPVGNERALAHILYRAEQDPEFLATLKNQVSQLAGYFVPEKEQASLEQALHLAMQRCSQRR